VLLRRKAPTGGESAGSRGAAAGAAEYTLPDGNVITAGAERSQAAEIYFDDRQGVATPLDSLVLNAVAALEPEQHKELLRNVVLTGGASCLAGLPERLEAALRLKASHAKGMPSIANQANRITIHTAPLPERRNGAWLGGSILASMASHTEFWMSRAEYDEHGASLAAQKGTHAFA